ncbi:maleylacetate reductase [Alteraurantiacibacter buctensis]|uniref:Iron-containing alcohol dehydrogenase n=1 Tax=Alteraurantiacibacter buctensis TaxID=1503981 RepID=A0A844Z3J5_9SPHN|nr:maleylacetate reductase [Alteraurantiacibacter buctensis]MXO73254.1 iron-containing alcohol dehydrogenase [Alteraurantiacibacter buctensis]
MQPFDYTALPGRVIFGSGTIARVPGALADLGGKRALVLTTPQQAAAGEQMLALLGAAGAGLFSGATMHTPVEVTEQALSHARQVGADSVVAVGGGSTTGLGKALALRTGLPQVVVPTTYAGSEATPILGQTENGVKTTQKGPEILPEVIVYDVDLTLSLPPALTVTSGINAIAHAVEGLYSKDANPVISLVAEDGIRALVSAIPRIVADPCNVEARSDALYGAWACGVTLGVMGMSLHHKLCHTLGGTFDLPHAETHTVILPHAMAYNAAAAPEALARVARAMGVADAPQGMWDLAKRLGAPMTLAEVGMPREGLERALQLALANPYWNPAPLEETRLRQLLEAAYEGRPPLGE